MIKNLIAKVEEKTKGCYSGQEIVNKLHELGADFVANGLAVAINNTATRMPTLIIFHEEFVIYYVFMLDTRQINRRDYKRVNDLNSEIIPAYNIPLIQN